MYMNSTQGFPNLEILWAALVSSPMFSLSDGQDEDFVVQ